MMMSLESPPQTTLTGGQRPQKKGGLNDDNHPRENTNRQLRVTDFRQSDG